MSNRYMRASVTVLADPDGRRIALIAVYWPHAENDVLRWEAWDIDAAALGDAEADELRGRVADIWDMDVSQVELTRADLGAPLVAAGRS